MYTFIDFIITIVQIWVVDEVILKSLSFIDMNTAFGASQGLEVRAYT